MEKKLKSLFIYKKNLLQKTGNEPQEELLLTENHYDSNTNLIKEIQYGDIGQVEQLMLFEYDENGFIISEELRDASGEVLEKKTYEPDDKGRMACEFIHYADESADKIQYDYDAEGRLVSKKQYDDEGMLEWHSKLAYNGDKLISEITETADGGLVTENTYEYNEKGFLVVAFINNTEESLWLRKEFEYDEEGNKLAITTFNQDGQAVERIKLENDDKGRPIQVVEENRRQKNTQILEYDEKGEIIFQEEHDVNGELVGQIERTFNNDGFLVESKVLIRNLQHGLTRNYSLRHEYSFYQ